MKTKIVLLLAITTFSLSAHSTDTVKRKLHHVYAGLSFCPGVSYRYMHPNSSPNLIYNGALLSNTQANTYPGFGANATVNVGYNINRWLAVESGVGYCYAQYRYIGYDSLKFTHKEIYQYVTIPVGLRFAIGHKRVKGILTAGAELDILFSQKVDNLVTNPYYNNELVSNTPIPQTSDFNTFNVTPYVGIGMSCSLTPYIGLRILPVARMQALKTINNISIDEYLWSVGLNVSILFGV